MIKSPIHATLPTTESTLLANAVDESTAASEVGTGMPVDFDNTCDPLRFPEATADRTEATASSLDRETIEWMIAEAAYYKAQQRKFEPGHEIEDWLAAEDEVVSRLARD